jgi:hypothetical protein
MVVILIFVAMKTKIYGELPQATVPGSKRIKLGKVLDQVPMGRFTKTTIEAILIDDAGKEVGSAPLLTSLDLNEIEVDDQMIVTNAHLSAPNAEGKRCWLVKSGAGIDTAGIGF